MVKITHRNIAIAVVYRHINTFLKCTAIGIARLHLYRIFARPGKVMGKCVARSKHLSVHCPADTACIGQCNGKLCRLACNNFSGRECHISCNHRQTRRLTGNGIAQFRAQHFEAKLHALHLPGCKAVLTCTRRTAHVVLRGVGHIRQERIVVYIVNGICRTGVAQGAIAGRTEIFRRRIAYAVALQMAVTVIASTLVCMKEVEKMPHLVRNRFGALAGSRGIVPQIGCHHDALIAVFGAGRHGAEHARPDALPAYQNITNTAHDKNIQHLALSVLRRINHLQGNRYRRIGWKVGKRTRKPINTADRMACCILFCQTKLNIARRTRRFAIAGLPGKQTIQLRQTGLRLRIAQVFSST